MFGQTRNEHQCVTGCGRGTRPVPCRNHYPEQQDQRCQGQHKTLDHNNHLLISGGTRGAGCRQTAPIHTPPAGRTPGRLPRGHMRTSGGAEEGRSCRTYNTLPDTPPKSLFAGNLNTSTPPAAETLPWGHTEPTVSASKTSNTRTGRRRFTTRPPPEKQTGPGNPRTPHELAFNR